MRNLYMNDLSLTFDDFLQFDSSLSDNQTYFIISQKNDNNEYETKKISIKNLVKSLSSYIFNIKSAAHAQSSDFALSTHDHDIYTSAYYTNELTDTIAQPILSVYDITHNSSLIVKTMPIDIDIVDTTIDNTQYLGEIQMIAISSLSYYINNFSYQSLSFDGWVLADGSEYELSDFILSSSISNVFDCHNTKFFVPNLNSFCRINIALNNNSSYDIFDGKTYLPLHTHKIQQIEDNNIIQIYSNDISIADPDQLSTLINLYALNPGSSSSNNILLDNVPADKRCDTSFAPGFQSSGSGATLGGNYGGPPNGQPNAKYPIYSETYSCLADISKTSLQNLNMLLSTGTDDEMSYPSHILMPTFIYVGPSRFSIN